ncbi:MAG TPA: chemotaxis protein CheB [Urbifossiella sp.]|nr:chemotaxis protein CheB [Urbifossiella sp.]
MPTEPTLPPPAGPDFPVVGVVSSAGGLDALKRLFGATAPAPGVAFVVVPHLDPGRDSLMAELLARHTRMPVVQATDGMRVAADHVYLIPPNATMRIARSALRLTPPAAAGGAAGSLDDFLTSLAADLGTRAVGVVLSGTGSHGTRGLRAVRAAGGRTVAQDPATAAFPSMPQAAIDAGVADEVPAPEAIPAALAGARPDRPPAAGAAAPGIGAVVDLIKKQTGRDFAAYRPGMLTRRVERRAGLAGLPGVGEYLAYLADHPDEVVVLVGDLLIGVTRFFRDPEAFAVLEAEVVPAVLRGKPPGADVRVWVPGCATGEEAYSVAMLFLERAGADPGRAGRVQVFATDMDVDALAAARAGVYPEAALAESVSPARRDRFFTPESDKARRVIKPLREAVVFAPQNVLSDPPFSRLDLICCRNLLIYLEPAAQQRVLGQFAFALSPGGFLFLGPSETPAGHADLFEPVSGPWRVFRRAGRAVAGRVDPVAAAAGAGPRPAEGRAEPAAPPARSADLAAQLLLAEFAPAAALVDAAGQVEYLSGPTGRFLDVPPGEPTRDLLALVRDGLRGVTRELLAGAGRGDPPGTVAAWVGRDDGHHPVRVTVRRVPAHRTPRPLFLVVFEEPAPAAPAPPADDLVRHLERELRAAREDLVATAAASQTAGEDTLAATEEMVSVNEELQSAVEELETSKEELQSLNEELTTTNAQLREKGEALAAASADITNLLNSTDLAAVFVGPDGRIRRFTPAATRLFRLIPADVGRPLADLAHVLLDPTLHDDLRAVLTGLDPPPEPEVAGPDDRWFLRRALPYRTADGRTDGVLLTFADITLLKRAEVALRRDKELDRLAAVLADSADAVVLVEADGRVSAWNRGAEQLYGYPAIEAVGMAVAAMIPDADRAAGLATLAAARLGEPVASWETRRVARDGRVLDVSVTATLLRPADDAPPAVSMIERDLTPRKRLERELRERSDRTEAILEAAADPIITVDGAGVIESANPATERAFGWPVADLVGRDIGVLMPTEFRAGHEGLIARYLAAREARVIGGGREVVCARRDGSTFPADLTVGQVDHIPRFVGILRDTTERRRLEREVLEIAAAEQERIGRELHDSVGQELTGLRLMAESLIGGLRDQHSPEAPLAVRLGDGLRDAFTRVRALSRGLVAAEVEPAGLAPALAALAERTRETSAVGCTCEVVGTPRPRDATTASHLLRIAQEAVANALRHSGATRIRITLTGSGAVTELRVRDDGRGFGPPAAATADGLGLKLMRYRAGLIGTSLHLESGEAGTLVACSAPGGPADVP